MFRMQNKILTSLSPSLSTLQWRKPVCPTVTVTFLCTSKSKYGNKFPVELEDAIAKLNVSAIEGKQKCNLKFNIR